MENKLIGIVIDTLGSDKGPETVILGASLALKKYPYIKVALVGPEQLIKDKIVELGMDESRIHIVPAEDTITNYENPTAGIFAKPNASIIQAMKFTKANDDYIGMLTAGASGALLMCSYRFLGKDAKTRPCLSAVLPHAQGSYLAVVDTGATIDCTPAQLHEFAHLGRDLMKQLYKIENPRVGLLSNGAEPTKGNHLVKETYPLLEADETINFIGNIEGNKSLSGECDVLVCDGFAGNQVLKNSEGMAKMLIKDLVVYSKKLDKPQVMEAVGFLMKKYDFASLGGGIVLGTKKPIIKCHGNSDETTIVNTCDILVKYVSGDYIFDPNQVEMK